MELNKCSVKLSLVKSLEIVLLFIEQLIKFVLFKAGVLIYAEHCIYYIKKDVQVLTMCELCHAMSGLA